MIIKTFISRDLLLHEIEGSRVLNLFFCIVNGTVGIYNRSLDSLHSADNDFQHSIQCLRQCL